MAMLRAMIGFFKKRKTGDFKIDDAIAKGISDTFSEMGYQMKQRSST